jgi:DNA-binding transcriptional ArsR family regulator
LVIDAASIELRRRLGPTAWAVFEELLLSSTGPTDRCTASVSVRSLASQLGLSKDTVARALGRLRRAGLVAACQARSTAGIFTTGSYRLTIPDTIAITTRTTRTTRPSSSHARARRPVDAQLALAIDS